MSDPMTALRAADPVDLRDPRLGPAGDRRRAGARRRPDGRDPASRPAAPAPPAAHHRPWRGGRGRGRRGRDPRAGRGGLPRPGRRGPARGGGTRGRPGVGAHRGRRQRRRPGRHLSGARPQRAHLRGHRFGPGGRDTRARGRGPPGPACRTDGLPRGRRARLPLRSGGRARFERVPAGAPARVGATVPTGGEVLAVVRAAADVGRTAGPGGATTYNGTVSSRALARVGRRVFAASPGARDAPVRLSATVGPGGDLRRIVLAARGSTWTIGLSALGEPQRIEAPTAAELG